MELSRESLDFGTCLVGQRRELQILISNKTASHSSWQTSIGNLYLLVSCSRYMAEILPIQRKTLYNQSIVSCKILLIYLSFIVGLMILAFTYLRNVFFLRSGPQWRFTLNVQYIKSDLFLFIRYLFRHLLSEHFLYRTKLGSPRCSHNSCQ